MEWSVLDPLIEACWFPVNLTIMYNHKIMHWQGVQLAMVIYFILSSEINAYQKQIKVISITSEMI